MKPGIPWSVKGIEPEAREAAKHAARRAGMTLGEWLNTVILDQNDEQPGPPASGHAPVEDYQPREPDPPVYRREAPPPRRAESTVRLEDIAHQLSQLAQRERESATIMPYEPPRARSDERETLNRILSRIDGNERQAVEAFTAVNERLSVLGRQIAMAARQPVFDKPDDVPGFSALEQAIRNVVEHLEISEKRTRDTLRAMQDRLGEMADRATTPGNPDELLRAAPAFASLEARLAEMAERLMRSETVLQSGVPELVRGELGQLEARIEQVRGLADEMALQAQSAAAASARGELRDIEQQIAVALDEAKATIGAHNADSDGDIEQLRGEIGGLGRRIDEVRHASASERDVQALRVAIEQLSARVAQGPDMRPLADMDRRLADLTRSLEQDGGPGARAPQFGDLERRVAELDHRLEEAMRLQGDRQSLQAMEQHLEAVTERVSRTEEQLGHLDTMERAIRQLYDSLEESRAGAGQMAEDAATRAIERFLAAQTQSGPSPELRAMEDGLRAVRESAANADQRNQETLEAVHETLEQIVNKLAELETASAGHQLAVNMAHHDVGGSLAPEVHQHREHHAALPAFAAEPEPEAESEPEYAPAGHEAQAEPQPVAGPEPSGHGLDADGDDFIAAARRAAQAAAARPTAPPPETRAPVKLDEGKRSRLSFLKRKQHPQPIKFVNGQQVVDKPHSNDNRRRKLVLAGIVLLAAVSALAVNMLAKPKPARQVTAIEAPVESLAQAQVPAILSKSSQAAPVAAAPLAAAATDPIATGSLPVHKTDATLASIVAEPGEARAEMPPADVGTPALREAASRGDATAQFIVAGRYLEGQGVAQDLPAAAYWYQQAASRGLAPAQYRLATLFERGKGVPQDAATALLWYERAAQSGNIKAMHNAAVIAAGNQAGTPDYDRAFRWFKAAAERGLHDSQFNLAVLYERGLGTRIDKTEAYFWFALAGRQGDKDAVARAQALGAGMAPAATAAAADRLAAFSPLPGSEESNVVRTADATWTAVPAQTAAVSLSEIAAPAAVVAAAPAAQPADPVIEAQQLLARLGYSVGAPDGKMGGRTANAIRLFQLQSGMKVTGQVSPELLDRMRVRAGA